MLARYALWCLMYLLLAGMLSAQQYDLRTYSLEHGLPGATVNDLCEDQDGYLWVATNEGAARTDGIGFATIGRAEGLPNDDITAVHCDQKGQIWLGCGNGAVVMMMKEGPVVIASGDRNWGPVQDLASDNNGVLWMAAASGGIFKNRDGKFEKDPSQELQWGRLNAMVLDPSGRPVCGTDSGLFVLEAARWIAVEPGSINRRVISLFADPAGLLVGTATGYVELDQQLKMLPPLERFAGLFPITIPDQRVLAIMRSRNGDIWLGTPSGSLQLTKRGGQPFLREIGEANGLGNDLVLTLHQDRSGAIWCGTRFGGLSRFMSDAFMHFTERDGLGSRIVSAIHRTPDGLLWMATMGGGVASWDGHEVKTYEAAEGLSGEYVLALGEDREGFLLAGTAMNGIYRWNGQQFVPAPTLAPIDHRVHVISLDEHERLWVGHDRGIRITDRNGSILDHIVPAGIMDIEPTSDTIWIATGSGLHFTAPSTPMLLEKYRVVPDLPLSSIASDLKNNLWIGTDGNGLLKLNGSRLDSITAEFNSLGSGLLLASNSVTSVLMDAHQNVWAGTRRGIHEVELDVMQELVLDIRHFGAEDGFIGIETFRNAALLDEDSTLWFGTLRGATRYDPQALHELHDEPQLHLTGIQLFFEDVDWSRWSEGHTETGIPIDLELPAKKNHLTFNFTGISLAYPEGVRYRYFLQGHDPDWSPITTTDRVIYSNIPPGDYTFKVMARNASGIWTEEPLTYSFSIIAPYWQRTWLQLLALLVLSLIVLGFIRIRERRAKQIQFRLEGMVQDRTKELAQEQQRSEDLLLNILPRSTAEELKSKGSAEARQYENCTVLFSDFTGFTNMSGHMDGQTLVADLDHFFRLFDRITDEYGIEKIKTIGDAYMCASGIPEPKPTHALDAVLTALSMLRAMEKSNIERMARGLQEWTIRIGIHSGPIVAGVVGEKKFAYDIWGDTVNLASRMESNSVPGRINISGVTYSQIMDFIEVHPRGPIKVRGKGELHMYFLLRLKPEFSNDPKGMVPNERLLRIREEMLSVMIT